MTVCRILRFTAVALTLAATGQAQTSSCEKYTVIASVLGDDGLPLRGLTAQNFAGELRGKPIRVASAAPLPEPRKIAVILDGSEGMRDASSGKWAMAQAVVGHIVENGPRNAEYTVAIAGMEEKRPVRGHAMEPIFLNKFSDLLQGIPMATHKARRAPIFDVIQGSLALLESSEPGDVVFLVTGLQRLYLQMMHAYRLELASDAAVTRSTTWKLKVSPPSTGPGKSLRVVYPGQIYPCEQRP